MPTGSDVFRRLPRPSTEREREESPKSPPFTSEARRRKKAETAPLSVAEESPKTDTDYVQEVDISEGERRTGERKEIKVVSTRDALSLGGVYHFVDKNENGDEK